MKPMYRFFAGTAKIVTRTLAYGTLGAIVVLVSLSVGYLENRPELAIWHEVELDTEFTADNEVQHFSDYLVAEEQVFQQLDELVYTHIPVGEQHLINRYSRGSLSDPGRWSRNWNRTFELPQETPRAGVLLLHGMSDSPYSLRGVGQLLHEKEAWVVGLRYPGHGTASSGLTEVRWQEMAAAVRLAMNHLQDKVGQQPIYIVGYSAGGALAVHYVLKALSENEYPSAAGIVLISPAIGVTPLAAFAVWQARLGHMLGLDKLEWSDIRPEYDPFKYNSFAVNAGDQVYRLTREISSLIEQHQQAGDLDLLPPVLAFQSSVDATVSTRALVDGLLKKLPPAGHELVLFDINRRTAMEPILQRDPRQEFEPLSAQDGLPFILTLVTNSDNTNDRVVLRRKSEGISRIMEVSTDLAWPRGIYSLSHVALPFREDDPLYGVSGAETSPGIHLGDLALRGERGVLQIPPSEMLRLRWNPFYPLMERRIVEFMGLQPH